MSNGNGTDNEILQLYRYIAERRGKGSIEEHEEGVSTSNLVNYHRSDRVCIKGKGFKYRRLTRIRSMKV